MRNHVMDLTIHHASRPSRRAVITCTPGFPTGKPGISNLPRQAPGLLRFLVPDVPYVRLLKFKFRTEDDAGTYWEPDVFIRQIRHEGCDRSVGRMTQASEFDLQPPAGCGPAGHTAASCYHQVEVQRRGRVCVESIRSDKPAGLFPRKRAGMQGSQTSTFTVPLQPWMANGFHFKLVAAGRATDDWEPDRANKVWRTADGLEQWLVSGQVSLRTTVVVATTSPLKLIHPRLLTTAPDGGGERWRRRFPRRP